MVPPDTRRPLPSELTPEGAATASAPSRRILVVEDDDLVRRLNAGVLARAGFRVDTARDGVEGWQAMCASPFDLLVTDHDMPRLTGLELVRRARVARMELPVIMATGALPAVDPEWRSWLRKFVTLMKPYSPAQLMMTVNRMLPPGYGPESDPGLSPSPPVEGGGFRGHGWRISGINE